MEGQTFRNLFILHEAPGPNPHIRRIKVVDRRWWWNLRTLRTGYNIRRKVGVKRLTAADTMADEVTQAIADRIAYAPFSLNNGKAWTAQDVLEDVLRTCLRAEEEEGSLSVAITGLDDSKVVKFLEKFPIENLILQGPAADGLQQLLGYLTGIGVCLTETGAVRVYLKTDGSETEAINNAGPAKQDRGWVQPISLASIRPSEIRVQFVRECEVRFDFEEGTTTFEQDARFMQNVIEIPDYSLEVSGRTLALGNWVDINSILTAWGEAPYLGSISLDFIRRAMVPFNGLWAALGLTGEVSPDADWSARVGALMNGYRRTYQINPAWMGRIFQLTAARVGLFDATTGMRAGATVYSDYSYIATRRSALINWRNIGSKSYIINVPGFAGGNLGSTTKAAPAGVSVINMDQGVIGISFMPDKLRVFEQILPSQIELANQSTAAGTRVPEAQGSPGADPRYNSIGFNLLGRGWQVPRLTASYKMAVILTAMPAMGGKKSRQFSTVVIRPDAVASFPGQDQCKGPPLEYLIGPGYETARIAWTDDNAENIEQVFGVGGGDIPDDELNSELDARTINLSTSAADGGDANLGGGASMNAIAKAAASRVWHSLADRYQGSMTATQRPGMVPTGWLSEVGYTVEPTGELSTSLTLPPTLPQLRLEQYLDATTRRIVLRLANPGG